MPKTLNAPGFARTALVVVTAAVISVFAQTAGAASFSTPTVAAGDPVIAAAGDIACDPTNPSYNGGLGTANNCRQKATSDLLFGSNLAAVLPLGDTQYWCGGLASYFQSYDPTWGRVKDISHPAVGNHEYLVDGSTDCDATGTGAGYFTYFGTAAGEPGKGYYSYDIGDWHLIALNSNCSKAGSGGCGPGSAQEQWLRADLAASTADCTLAYWHHPLFTSGKYSPGVLSAQPLFQALYDHRADVVLSGHDHNYERFAPQSPTGALDLDRGIREFVVGTGGASHYAQGVAIPNSEARNSDAYGVLELTLHPTGYEWQFVTEAGVVADNGLDTCDGTAPDTNPPTAPANLTADPASSSRVDLGWTASSDDVAVIRYDLYRNGTFVDSTTTTSYTDTTVSEATSYDYVVKARDAAGNESPPSNTATVTTPTNTMRQTFAAEADARVEEANPSTNYATSTLRADGGSGPDVESYLRFAVNGLTGAVKSAHLRVFAYTGTADGPAVYGADNTWSETAVVWSDRPAATGGAVADKAAIPANTWVDYDVTPLVTANGTFNFKLATTSSDGVDFRQREVTTEPPELIVTYEQQPYTHPIGASPLRSSLVPAFIECDPEQASASHAGPLAAPSCDQPRPSSSIVAVGGSSLAFARFRVLGQGECATRPPSACYPDVVLAAGTSDVRAGTPIGPDYDTGSGPDLTLSATLPGEAQGSGLRLTDRGNQSAAGPSFDQAATVSPLSFPIPLDCVPTDDPTIGSACNAQTTVNTLVPGSVIAGERALWELGQLQLLDPGADGTAGNGDDSVFEGQGVFVP